MDAKSLLGPRLFVIHVTLNGMILEQNARTDAQEFRHAVAHYVRQVGPHVIAVSRLKGESWGFPENIVPVSADPQDYLPWEGDLAKGLRVSNFILRRARTLHWDFHQRAFAGVPLTLVGHNPELSGVRASQGWSHLKEILRHHPFFVHTAHPDLEGGYNMATLEAMAAGLPVLMNIHGPEHLNPASPYRAARNCRTESKSRTRWKQKKSWSVDSCSGCDGRTDIRSFGHSSFGR